MTSQRKLELDLLHADLAAVNNLLDQISVEDVMARIGLQDRRDELKALIRSDETEEEAVTASATLLFGGRPVTGMHGIESKFATSAVGTYQDMVAQVLAHKTSSLSSRGKVAKRESATLHITRLVRGSVGFVLEELRPRANLTDTPLTEAVNEATELLDAFGASDEGRFHECLNVTHSRVIGSVGKFFRLLHRNGATLRLVTQNSDHSFGVQVVKRASERAKSTITRTEKQNIPGRLAGVLPDAGQFEFCRDDKDEVITGKIADDIDAHALASTAEQWLNLDMQASVEVRKVYRNNELVKEDYTLSALTLSSN